MWQSQRFTTLQSSQQHSRFDPGGGTEWWGLDLTMEPNQRFVSPTHGQQYMSVLTYRQAAPGNLTRRCSRRLGEVTIRKRRADGAPPLIAGVRRLQMAVPNPQPQRRLICVGAVLVHDDAVLFVRHSPGHSLAGQWTIPWGILEDNEQPSEAVVREVAEESGICASVDGLLGVQAIPPPWAGQLALLFRCRYTSGELTPDGRETDATRYFTADELVQLDEPIEPFCRWIALEVLEGRVRTLTCPSGNPYAPTEGFFLRAV